MHVVCVCMPYGVHIHECVMVYMYACGMYMYRCMHEQIMLLNVWYEAYTCMYMYTWYGKCTSEGTILHVLRYMYMYMQQASS